MDSISTDQKLELIKSIRNENSINYEKINHRVGLLYGNEKRSQEETMEDTTNPTVFHSVKLRFLLAFLIFGVFFIWDKQDISVMGYHSSEFVDFIKKDFNLNTFDFIEDITYNLNHYMKIEVTNE
ncbi:MAG TPA: hypothetical protein VJZ04_04420 [Lachnospiraceae bacterium]|nr:hypothetical protein [Lachnospiraceae bacterium]